MAEIFGDSHTKFEMYHQSNNKSGGSATGSLAIQLLVHFYSFFVAPVPLLDE